MTLTALVERRFLFARLFPAAPTAAIHDTKGGLNPMIAHGRRNRLFNGYPASADELPVGTPPRAEPALVPAARCSGCGKAFRPGQYCLVGNSGMGGHAAAITYCFGCRDDGWPCERFALVLHS